MILWMVLSGLGLATLGTFFLAIDALTLLQRSSEEEAQQIYRERSPSFPAPAGEPTREWIRQLTQMIARRKRLYAAAVILLLIGFVLQAIGTAL